jgi:uncharacterized protein YecE (DUF72 family)
MPGSIRIGISGFTYDSWRGSFYPPGLPRHRELEYASRRLSSIEINGSFYSLQRPKSFARWNEETPDDFVFAVKASRYITHVLRLNNTDDQLHGALANFFASGISRLGTKLGPILWQLPPNFRFDPLRIEQFLDLLPRNGVEASRLASHYEDWMQDRAAPDFDSRIRIRHALEVRHDSFIDEDFLALLRAYRVAVVIVDGVQGWPVFNDLTSDFAYVRFHGTLGKHEGRYPDQTLDLWADRMDAWSHGEPGGFHRRKHLKSGIDVFGYFNNDVKAHAPRDALRLIERLDLRLEQRAHGIKHPRTA